MGNTGWRLNTFYSVKHRAERIITIFPRLSMGYVMFSLFRSTQP